VRALHKVRKNCHKFFINLLEKYFSGKLLASIKKSQLGGHVNWHKIEFDSRHVEITNILSIISNALRSRNFDNAEVLKFEPRRLIRSEISST
jgi:hypothetical protein